MVVHVRTVRAEEKVKCIQFLGMLADAAEGTVDPRAADAFDDLLNEQRGQVIVAEEDGTLLGMATVSYNLAMRYGGEYCQLEELIVDPSARGKNVGGLLVEETIARAKSRGCAEYGLYLVATTEKNLPFYEKYGFKRVGSELRQELR